MHLHPLFTETHFIMAALASFIALGFWLGWRGYQRRLETRDDDFARADRAAIYEGDRYARQLAQLAEERPMQPAARLKTAEARTQQLAALQADVRPAGVIAADDYITGEIVAIKDVPPYSDVTTRIFETLEEIRTDWHWIGGELHAPTALLDALPEDDWLHELLVAA